MFIYIILFFNIILYQYNNKYVWIKFPPKKLSKQIFLKFCVGYCPSALTHADASKRSSDFGCDWIPEFHWNMFLIVS